MCPKKLGSLTSLVLKQLRDFAPHFVKVVEKPILHLLYKKVFLTGNVRFFPLEREKKAWPLLLYLYYRFFFQNRIFWSAIGLNRAKAAFIKDVIKFSGFLTPPPPFVIKRLFLWDPPLKRRLFSAYPPAPLCENNFYDAFFSFYKFSSFTNFFFQIVISQPEFILSN